MVPRTESSKRPQKSRTTYFIGKIHQEKFEQFLYLLDTYVRWESLEGVPYIKMESINVSNKTDLNETELENGFIEYIKNIDLFKVKTLIIKELKKSDLNIVIKDRLINKIKYYKNNKRKILKKILKKNLNLKILSENL